MSEETKKDDFVNVTDCLEAISSFKVMKNFLFFVLLICLAISVLFFWLADRGFVELADVPTEQKVAKIAPVTIDLTSPVADEIEDPKDAENILTATAQKVTADVNSNTALAEPVSETDKQKKVSVLNLSIDFSYVRWIIKVTDAIMMFAAVLYCLVLMFGLKVSLLGTMGGISHISKAFFFSLWLVVFMFPWQKFFGPVDPVAIGAMYMPAELKNVILNRADMDIFAAVQHYLRFAGWQIVVIVLLLGAQRRSGKWSKAVMRRLGID